MHTQVAHTSIRTYRDIKKDGTISTRQRQIMLVIQPYPADYSLQELCELERGPSRACRITGRTIKPVRRPHPQGALF